MKLEINRDELESIIHLGDVTDPCPYLPGKEATFRFGNGHLASGHYEQLLAWGYRRNGNYVYRPVCSSCQECWVLRVPVDTFTMTKSQRRVWNRGVGTFGALYEIEYARSLGLFYYYLGYYIGGCGSMSYKGNFKPYELLDMDGRWRLAES